MRPLRLEVQGFGAFREHTEIDFDRADLFALVGPTGSGKSTVIDAICFALYGTVPRYDDRRNVTPAITSGTLEAKVSLTFEAAGRAYVATRVVRGGKTAGTREARLEEVGGEVLAGKAREMGPRVEQLLGLTFDQFTRAVVLPQNEFARFLHDKPSDRQDLLVRLLGFDVYERMRKRAREAQQEHERTVALAGQAQERLADCTEEERDSWKEWTREYASLAKEVRGARGALAELEQSIAAATAEAERHREAMTRLQRVGVPAKFASLAAARDEAATAVVAAEETAGRAAASVDEARAALDRLGPRDPLLAARDAHRDLDRFRGERDVAAARADKAKSALAPAAAALAEAEAARETLQVAHAAHALVGSLTAGEPCPVCEQPVTKVPRRRAPAGLATVEKQVDRARRTDQKARDEAAKAAEAVVGLEARVRELEARVTAHADVAAVGEQLAASDAAGKVVADAELALRAARSAEAEARTQLARTQQGLKQAATEFRDQRDALVQIGAEPPPEHDDLAADWPALAAWAEGEVPVRTEAAAAADARVDALGRERGEHLDGLLARARELRLELAPRASVDDLTEALVRAEERAQAEVARLERGIEERARLDAELAGARDAADVAGELARLLSASHFERWLVAEALDLLVAGASARLEELSAGQFSLAYDESSPDLQVVDHANADECRSVRTLSGGETFQASLALALALADQLSGLAADGAARLESIFLDEGFGALDADTLETVATTIESLGVGDRMVGVVTHVRDLAERMPVQYRVAKGARTATVERVDR